MAGDATRQARARALATAITSCAPAVAANAALDAETVHDALALLQASHVDLDASTLHTVTLGAFLGVDELGVWRRVGNPHASHLAVSHFGWFRDMRDATDVPVLHAQTYNAFTVLGMRMYEPKHAQITIAVPATGDEPARKRRINAWNEILAAHRGPPPTAHHVADVTFSIDVANGAAHAPLKTPYGYMYWRDKRVRNSERIELPVKGMNPAFALTSAFDSATSALSRVESAVGLVRVVRGADYVIGQHNRVYGVSQEGVAGVHRFVCSIDELTQHIFDTFDVGIDENTVRKACAAVRRTGDVQTRRGICFHNLRMDEVCGWATPPPGVAPRTPKGVRYM